MLKIAPIIKERNIADWMTLSALFPILLSYYFILQGSPDKAVIAYSVSFLLDNLDGYLARRLKIASEFGRQLDSFVDVFNYLVLGGIFAIKFLNHDPLLTFFSVIIMLGAGIARLIKFNSIGPLDVNGKKYYLGLPVPFVSFLMLATFYLSIYFWQGLATLTPLILFILAALMLSKIKISKKYSQALGLLASLFFVCLAIINLLK